MLFTYSIDVGSRVASQLEKRVIWTRMQKHSSHMLHLMKTMVILGTLVALLPEKGLYSRYTANSYYKMVITAAESSLVSDSGTISMKEKHT